jgi:L-cysteine desulfidase
VVRGEHDNVEKIVFNGETLAAPQKKTRLEVKNLKHAEEIMKKDTGELQQIVKKFMEKQGLLIEELDYDNIIDAVEQVVLQRMEGESIRVQTITGSGNQGIFLALPLYSRFQKEGEDFLPAALFSVLVQTYLTRREKRLTDKCGLITKSGPALLAGFLYYRGVDIEEIENRMDLLVESARGVLCEGAKPSCALKAYMSLGMVERIENPEGKSIWKF